MSIEPIAMGTIEPEATLADCLQELRALAVEIAFERIKEAEADHLYVIQSRRRPREGGQVAEPERPACSTSDRFALEIGTSAGLLPPRAPRKRHASLARTAACLR